MCAEHSTVLDAMGKWGQGSNLLSPLSHGEGPMLSVSPQRLSIGLLLTAQS